MNALLSIKPPHVEAIVKGDKRYEFRKSIFRKKKLETVYIYSTTPVKKIVGSFRIGRIIEDYPERLWNQLNRFSGLSYLEFFHYFEGKEKGFAIEIESVVEFKNPIDPKDFIPNFLPPQSFYYLDSSILLTFLNHLNPCYSIKRPTATPYSQRSCGANTFTP